MDRTISCGSGGSSLDDRVAAVPETVVTSDGGAFIARRILCRVKLVIANANVVVTSVTLYATASKSSATRMASTFCELANTDPSCVGPHGTHAIGHASVSYVDPAATCVGSVEPSR